MVRLSDIDYRDLQLALAYGAGAQRAAERRRSSEESEAAAATFDGGRATPGAAYAAAERFFPGAHKRALYTGGR